MKTGLLPIGFLACLGLAVTMTVWAESTPNLVEDGGFEMVREVNVGADKYVYDVIQDGMELVGGKGPIVRIPSNLSLFCGGKRLHIVEGTPGKEVHSGKTAIRLTGSYYLKSGGPAAMGDVYKIQFYAKGDGAARLILALYGENGKNIGQAVPPPAAIKSADWKLVEYTLATNEFPNLKSVGSRLETTGDVTIDDLSLTKIRSAAASSGQSLPIAFALQTATPMVIDGQLTEACWQKAIPNGPLFQINDNSKAGQPLTYFKVAYDDTKVYIGIEAREPEMAKIKQEKGEHDSWPGGSSIEFFLDPTCSRSSYYQLAADLAGTQYDARGHDSKWDVKWDTAVQKAGDRWTMEVAIPFADLEGGAPLPGMLWGLNLCRNREGGQSASSTWAKVGANFHEPGRFNTLIFGTIPQWRERQVEQATKTGARLHDRLQGLAPHDAVLETKLAAAERRLQALAPLAEELSPYSAEFLSLYEEVQAIQEDYRAIDNESEAALAIQQVLGSAQAK